MKTILRFALIFVGVLNLIAAENSNEKSQLKKIQVNGIELHYMEQGKGVPEVFVHGGLDDYRYWSAEMEPFAQHYRAVTYSRRYNYPNENGSLRSDHSAIVEAEDLAALIKELKLPAAHVVGASYGAYTALFLALKHPELVRTLVLAEPPVVRWLPNLPQGNAAFEDIMNNCWKPVGRTFQSGDDTEALRLTVHWFVGNGYVLPGGATSFDSLPEEMRTYLLGNAREWKALTTSTDAFPKISPEDVKKMKVPTLILSGEKTLELHKLIDAELERLLTNKKRVIIPNASHDMWSEYPELCREATLAFLASH